MATVLLPSAFPRSTTTNALERKFFIPLSRLEASGVKQWDALQKGSTPVNGESDAPGKPCASSVVVPYQACIGAKIFDTFLACIGPSISPKTPLAKVQRAAIFVI